MVSPLLILKSPAKVNLTLDIKEKREDGYHNIDSLVSKISLHDELIFYPGEDSIEFILMDNFINLNNMITTAHKALYYFKERFKKTTNVKVKIIKKIPIESGLGGGSSNGATLLKGLNIINNYPLPDHEIKKIGLEIGSDVPIFLNDLSLLRVRGRGEIIEAVPNYINLHLIIILTGINISTVRAYCLWDKYIGKRTNFTQFTENFLNSTKIDNLGNSFLTVIAKEFPQINYLRNILLDNGAPSVCLSGSGGTIFVPFDDSEKAKTFLKNIISIDNFQNLRIFYENIPPII